MKKTEGQDALSPITCQKSHLQKCTHVRYFISPYCLHTPYTSERSKMDFLAWNTVLIYLLIDEIKHLDKEHEYLQIVQETPVWFAKTSVHVIQEIA